MKHTAHLKNSSVSEIIEYVCYYVNGTDQTKYVYDRRERIKRFNKIINEIDISPKLVSHIKNNILDLV